ncbi:lipopolysaccharide biosynthesis protein [Xylanibacter muris]|uniref:Lipopolysaccharide biosynthesis protein n=1 Tax=Xylanibacter muris TaxID=2736290 RepID=A0ABX2AMF0_9BACT|nr:lipopolysaccharide biosynthesis protein [Xylanibacter muris]NPD91121.1 lipopolysaccharide biosynthesis protein [Xylanibacter muris]
MDTLKEKTAKGMFWGGLNNGVQQLIGLVFGIILGRLLSPKDYGMMAMISIFPLIASTLQNSGFTSALANMRNPGHKEYNSVFWFNIIMGLSLYALLWICAPVIAGYYHNPKLIPLCRYAFLCIIASSFGTAQTAYLFKNLMVKQQAIAGMTAILSSSIIGVTMAWLDMSYWSLATQTIVFVGVNTLMTWHLSPWRPTMNIDFTPIKSMFTFSSKILATNILIHVNNNILNILLGRHFSATDTGHYNQAYQWNTKGTFLVQGMVQQVAQPVLAGLNNDSGRQLNTLRKMMRFTAFISFPLLFGMALISYELIIITIKEQWIASTQLLKILCIGGSTMPLCTLLSNMVISKGRSDIYFRCTLALCITQVVLMMTIWPLGIRNMVIAYAMLNILWMFVWQYITYRLTGYTIMMFLRDIVPFALAAATVMTATHFITLAVHNNGALLAIRIMTAAAGYYAVMKVAKVKILDECMEFITSKIKRSKPDGHHQ